VLPSIFFIFFPLFTFLFFFFFFFSFFKILFQCFFLFSFLIRCSEHSLLKSSGHVAIRIFRPEFGFALSTSDLEGAR